MSHVSERFGPELEDCDPKRKSQALNLRNIDTPMIVSPVTSPVQGPLPTHMYHLPLPHFRDELIVLEGYSPSRAAQDPFLSIKKKAEKAIHHDMQRIVDCLLEMPDNPKDFDAWSRRSRARCAAARSDAARARWIQLASANIRFAAANRSPSPSVSSDNGCNSEFSEGNDWRKYTRWRETSSVEY
jgi:hypothetical protein